MVPSEFTSSCGHHSRHSRHIVINIEVYNSYYYFGLLNILIIFAWHSHQFTCFFPCFSLVTACYFSVALPSFSDVPIAFSHYPISLYPYGAHMFLPQWLPYSPTLLAILRISHLVIPTHLHHSHSLKPTASPKSLPLHCLEP